VDTSVVDDVGLDDLIAVGLHDLREAPAQQVVAHVSQVEWLIGVGRRILNHHEWTALGSLLLTVLSVGVDVVEQADPSLWRNDEIKESLDHIEACHSLAVTLEHGTDFLCGVLGLFT